MEMVCARCRSRCLLPDDLFVKLPKLVQCSHCSALYLANNKKKLKVVKDNQDPSIKGLKLYRLPTDQSGIRHAKQQSESNVEKVKPLPPGKKGSSQIPVAPKKPVNLVQKKNELDIDDLDGDFTIDFDDDIETTDDDLAFFPNEIDDSADDSADILVFEQAENVVPPIENIEESSTTGLTLDDDSFGLQEQSIRVDQPDSLHFLEGTEIINTRNNPFANKDIKGKTGKKSDLNEVQTSTSETDRFDLSQSEEWDVPEAHETKTETGGGLAFDQDEIVKRPAEKEVNVQTNLVDGSSRTEQRNQDEMSESEISLNGLFDGFDHPLAQPSVDESGQEKDIADSIAMIPDKETFASKGMHDGSGQTDRQEKALTLTDEPTQSGIVEGPRATTVVKTGKEGRSGRKNRKSLVVDLSENNELRRYQSRITTTFQFVYYLVFIIFVIALVLVIGPIRPRIFEHLPNPYKVIEAMTLSFDRNRYQVEDQTIGDLTISIEHFNMVTTLKGKSLGFAQGYIFKGKIYPNIGDLTMELLDYSSKMIRMESIHFGSFDEVMKLVFIESERDIKKLIAGVPKPDTKNLDKIPFFTIFYDLPLQDYFLRMNADGV